MDWWDTPLKEFYPLHEIGEDGKTTGRIVFLHGDGKAQEVMRGLQDYLERAYEELFALEDFDRFESSGEVPVIRDGAKRYEPISEFTLRDLPAILDTFAVLEEERSHEEVEERERKAAERKRRERVRAKERRKLKKLGEW
jgi:hypothetical protein